MTTEIVLSIIAIIISIIAITVSVLSWSKSRAVYGLKEKIFFDKGSDKYNEQLMKLLNLGNYNILTILEKKPNDGNGVRILQATIKK
jgi:hypothetical protein